MHYLKIIQEFLRPFLVIILITIFVTHPKFISFRMSISDKFNKSLHFVTIRKIRFQLIKLELNRSYTVLKLRALTLDLPRVIILVLVLLLHFMVFVVLHHHHHTGLTGHGGLVQLRIRRGRRSSFVLPSSPSILHVLAL